MRCHGCLRAYGLGFCPSCRKRLFEGARVQTRLSFEAPNSGNLGMYQSYSRRMSISGVQLKYSLRREGDVLSLADAGGGYILKPIPDSRQLAYPEAVPANEHLTMQMAVQVFGMPVAPNALVYFSDGGPAYLTRRFDIGPDGGKLQQEDFAQISGRTPDTDGTDYKYAGSYEEAGKLIQRYVAAAIPAVELFFRHVVFNYVVSNGDAHLKNFSLLRVGHGEYRLSPAYDLLSTVIHSPGESDTALPLYQDDHLSPFYGKHGFHGGGDFLELARRLSILPQRAERILRRFAENRDRMVRLVTDSFLPETIRDIYLRNLDDRLARLLLRASAA